MPEQQTWKALIRLLLQYQPDLGLGCLSSLFRQVTLIAAPLPQPKIIEENIIGYGKCSKILNTFLFLFSVKIMVIRADIHKMHARIANREDPDLKQSDLGLHCMSSPFWQATLKAAPLPQLK